MRRDAWDGARTYLARNPWALGPKEVLPDPAASLKVCVVIPSLAEAENLPAVLDSLVASRRLAEAEVLVLVNQSENAPPAIRENNLRTLELRAQYARHPLPVYFLDRASEGRALPAGQAGVGLARRAGLDAGLERLLAAGNLERAALACLDADSPVGPGYLDAILEVFDSREQPVAAYCSYAHPRPEDPRLEPAMAAYELWLRYWETGLSAAGSWFAFPTIGSCTVVSAWAYAQVGGLEPRQAAEDFHFLRKLAKLSGTRPLAHIHNARVHPAARISERVPFGTGRAMQRSLAEGQALYLQVEPPEVFLHLREFFRAAPAAYREQAQFEALPPRLRVFLENEGAWEIFRKFRRIYPAPQQFTRAVQHWFDSLRITRYANEVAREQGKVWAFDAWRALLQSLGCWERFAGLPFPQPGHADAALQFQWLQALRGL